MLGTFIDTLVICTMTGLVLVVTGVWSSGLEGDYDPKVLRHFAFGKNIPSMCIVLFAFTTMLGWSYYGERCAEFLVGPKIIIPYRIIWVIGIYLGTQMSLGVVWKMSDALNGLMAIPNLIALILLSPVVFSLTKAYFNSERQVSSDEKGIN